MKKQQRLPDSWEAAAKLVGVDPKALPNVSKCVERLKLFVVDMYKRAIVTEALNKAAGLSGKKRWKPDYNNGKWDKYYAWGIPGKDAAVPSGFGFSYSAYGRTCSDALVCSRLEFCESRLVEHMFSTPDFRQILVNTMVIPPNEK